MISASLVLGCGVSGPDSPRSAAQETAEQASFSRAGEGSPSTQGPSDRRRPLRVGTSGDYPPFSDWPAGAREPSGFSIDVARGYARDRGRAIEWVRFRWPELASDLTAKRFDLALSGITVRPDRSIAGRFSLPLTTSGAVALVEEDSDLTLPTQLDEPDVGIAVNAGGHLERVARRLFPRARIDARPRNDQVLTRLGLRGIRAVLTDSLEAPLWKAERPGLREIGPLTQDRKAAWFPIPSVDEHVSGRSIDARPKGRAIGSAGDQEIRRFDRWLLAAEASGRLAAWRAAHGLTDTPTADPKYALLASLDDRLALMVDVASAKQTLATPIEDPAREAFVLEAALREVDEAARRLGLAPPAAARVAPVFRAQIEAAKAVQRSWTESHPSAAIAPHEGARRAAEAELSGRIRPALIDLGQRISTLLVVAAASGRSGRTPTPLEGLSYAEVASFLARHDLPELHLRSLHAALVGLSDADANGREGHEQQSRAATRSGLEEQPRQPPREHGQPEA